MHFPHLFSGICDQRLIMKRLTWTLLYSLVSLVVGCSNNNVDFSDEARAMHHAVAIDDLKTVKLLLARNRSLANAMNNAHSRQRPLHTAAYSNSMSVAKVLLASGADAKSPDWLELTPLHIAASEGYKDFVELLIKYGAAVDQADATGSTPLFLASVKGDGDTVKLLLDNGAGNRNVKGPLPIHGAVLRGNGAAIERLLEYGTNPDLCDENGKSPLESASLAGNDAIVDLLLKRGATKTPAYAALVGDADLLRAMIERDDSLIGKLYWDQESLLHLAVIHDRSSIVKMLIAHGAGTSTSDRMQMTPLHLACKHVSVGSVPFLLPSTHINSGDNLGNSPIHYACEAKSEALVRLLLAQQAIKLDLANNELRTPLMVAVANNAAGICSLVACRKCAINAQDRNGFSAMHIATRKSDTKSQIIVDLLAAGSDLSVKDKYGFTPLDYAPENTTHGKCLRGR
jgi:ankyrin repeat protein